MKAKKMNNGVVPGLAEIIDKYFDGAAMLSFTNEIKAVTEKPDFSLKGINDILENSVQAKEIICRQVDTAITHGEKNLSLEKQLLLFNSLGKLTIELGEFTLAKHIFLKSLKLANKDEKYENISAYSYYMLGDIYNREARWDRSLEHIKKAVKLFQEQKDVKGLAKCKNLIGVIYLGQGKINLSSKHFDEGISLLSHKRDKSILAQIETNLGILKGMQGDYDSAYTYFRRALLKFEETGKLIRIAEVRYNLGMLHAQKKQYDLALSEYDLCLKISVSANYMLTQGIALLGKASIYAHQDQLQLAKTFA